MTKGTRSRAWICAGHVLGCLIGSAALVSLPGCSGGSKLPTVPASGTVTYNGAPLEGATVTFVPKSAGAEDTNAKGASAVTDSQGRFKLQTLLSGEKMAQGALPGDYLVSVSKMEFSRPGAGGVEMSKNAAPSQGGSARTSGPVASPMMRGAQSKSLIPQKYSNTAESGFSATIGPSGKTDMKFELTD